MEKLTRDDVLKGATYKVKFNTDESEISLYLTINNYNDKPFEIFANSKNAKLTEHLTIVMVLISHLLQTGTDVEKVAQYLKEIHSPFTGHFKKGGHCSSLYSRIGELMLFHYTNFNTPKDK